MSHPPRRDRRRLAFAVLVTACVAGGAAYTAWAAFRVRSGNRPAGNGPVTVGDAAAGRTLIDRARPTVMFRNGVVGEHWGKVALVPTAAPDGPRTILPLQCQRLHFAAGRGLCIVGNPGVFSTYSAYTFGADFAVVHKLRLSGLPSRARVSPDGRYGAVTVFVSGHSYSDGSFSTKTTLIDLTSGADMGNLEEFTVLRDGHPFKAIDFNFWGVTFAADGNHFYATLLTGGQTYLVEGAIEGREMRVLRPNVECPSLSPDGTRLAFKKRVGGGGRTPPVWRFHVLDLATMTETALAETRSIDDQTEWLDNDHVLYQIGPDLWTVATDGSGEPRRFMRSAVSPAVIRTAVTLSPPQTRTLSLPSADLAVTMTAAPNPVRVGQDLTYTVAVSNRGPAAAKDLGIDVRLSPAVTFGALGRRSPPTTPHSCYFRDGYISCSLYGLASGESWVVEFTLKPNVAGLVRNQVRVDGAQPDPAPGNNSATVETAVTTPFKRPP
jgi:uncharacterized repeat protein (TIGR01451 family)